MYISIKLYILKLFLNAGWCLRIEYLFSLNKEEHIK